MQSPIVKRILMFGIMSASISLILACLGFGIVEFYKIKGENEVKVNSQMDILAYNLQTPLLFDDREAATKTLLYLKNDKSINNALLYKADGSVFASYIKTHSVGNVSFTKLINYDGKLIGYLEIQSVYLGIKEKYIAYSLISIIIFLISIVVSFIISIPIRNQVSKGVVQLENQSNRLRLLADQVAATEQSERKRIAAIIHDHLQQLLVAGKLQLGLAMRELNKEQYDKTRESLGRVDNFLNEATRAAKTLTVELRPPVLYEDGLEAAFQWLANKFKNDHNLEIVLHFQEMPRSLSDTLKIMIFESVKELLFNIVKYAGVNTADLYLKYEKGIITVLVKDQGCGFNPHHIERTASDKGFGLFSIRERLRLLNGELKITSQEEHGTEVEIQIPVITVDNEWKNETEPLKDIQPLLSEVDKKIKILLADDHTIVREGIANLLKENPSFNVIAQAENGREAVEKAELFHPDVIIMDINMPKLNGIEATREIKNKFPHIEIIGLSVQDESDIVDSMKKAGAVTLLNKAGDPQELIQTILNVTKRNV